MVMSDSTKEFILHWGEMGTRWGVNRTVAQVHALLYLSPEPLTAEDIADALSVARSNVSTSLKELQNWNLVQTDVWTLFLTVVDQRVEREIIPTMNMLQRLVVQARAERPAQPVVTARITAMQLFLEELHGWYTQIKKLPPASLHSLISIGSGITRFLPKSRRRRLD
jgi:DNA-binding transcriptional regulator GbsR (MarR family)